MDLGLIYARGGGLELGYIDSDWARIVVDRKTHLDVVLSWD